MPQSEIGKKNSFFYGDIKRYGSNLAFNLLYNL